MNIVRKDIRKEQDGGSCIEEDLNVLSLWPEVSPSPFCVEDKSNQDPTASVRVIHDLSYPDAISVNAVTGKSNIPPAEYEHCGVIAKQILHQSDLHPDTNVEILVGGVTLALRHLSIHSEYVHMLSDRLELDNALVIDHSAFFGCDIVIETDTSNNIVCVLERAAQPVLVHRFFSRELDHAARFLLDHANNFEINYRKLLARGLAVRAWGASWESSSGTDAGSRPIHIHFRIDSTSAVAWQNEMASRNPRTQVIIRLLGYWKVTYGFRFSSSHVAGAEDIIDDFGSRLTDPSHHFLLSKLTHGWSHVSPPIDSAGLEQI
ncbi:hypothetical protein BBJ28_00013483 [Nothophytophthora sp. Chile5]|nr:hypothetical protein BBJ28_00013483 [Nothophytophthora sp. Chile5]